MSQWNGVGSPGAYLFGGAVVSAFNNIAEAAPIVVALANAQRTRITFYNPGTAKLYIAPAKIQNVIGTAPTTPSDVILTPSNAAKAGCIPLFGEGYLVIDGACGGAYQAFAETGAGSANALTVVESNVS